MKLVHRDMDFAHADMFSYALNIANIHADIVGFSPDIARFCADMLNFHSDMVD